MFFFLSAVVNVEEVKTIFEIGDAELVLSNVSEIIEDIPCKLMKLVFFNDEFNGIRHFTKKSHFA